MAPRKRDVRLFAHGELIARRWTQRDVPAEYYSVDGDIYDVTSFAVNEEPGAEGFDVQVAARP